MADQKPPYGLTLPKKGNTWVYNFQVHGQRYSRSTGETTLRAAIKVAAAEHTAAVKGEDRQVGKRKPDITIDDACGRFYEERGADYARPEEILTQLSRLAERLGPQTPLSRITMDDLLKYQTRRRRDPSGRKDKDGKPIPLSNRSVNRDIPETLRPVIKQARAWGVDLGPMGEGDFDWSLLKRPLPAHRTRSASRDELARLIKAVRKDYRPLVMFARLSGLRKSNLLLEKRNIDWKAKVINYRKKSKKRELWVPLPMTPRIERLLARECAKAPKCDYVFTFLCERPTGKDQEKGMRYPITASGFRRIMEKAEKDAKLEDWRLIHDLRHTSATETLRATQNLALVQQMLGHSDIAQTSRYAHVLLDDLREGMAKPRR